MWYLVLILLSFGIVRLLDENKTKWKVNTSTYFQYKKDIVYADYKN